MNEIMGQRFVIGSKFYCPLDVFSTEASGLNVHCSPELPLFYQ